MLDCTIKFVNGVYMFSCILQTMGVEMKAKHLLLIPLLVSSSYAGVVENFASSQLSTAISKALVNTGTPQAAIVHISRAVVASPIVKEQIDLINKKAKKVERMIIQAVEDITGVSKKNLAIGLTIADSLIKGEVTSEKFKYRIKVNDNLQFRPDMGYNWKNDDFKASLRLTYSF